MKMDWKRIWFVTVLIPVVLRVDASVPPDRQDNPDGFWFGTQSLLCTTSKVVGPAPRLTRKRSISSEATPERNSLRYIHRLVCYKDTVFEWGTGVRGYHWGLTESITDCPVTWERSPAGRGHCPVDAVINYTRLYRGKFGPYHLLTNNCHHFTNRVSALLSDPDCGGTSGGNRGVAGRIVSMVERSLWKVVSFVLSYVDPASSVKTEVNETPETGYVVE